MSKPMTFSTIGVDWSKEGLILNPDLFTGQSFQPSGALMDRRIDAPMFRQQHYRIRVRDGHAKAFHVLLRNGAGMAFPDNIYVVSTHQLDNLRRNGVEFDVL